MLWKWKKRWQELEHYIELRKSRGQTNIDIEDLEIIMYRIEHGQMPPKPWPIYIEKG